MSILIRCPAYLSQAEALSGICFLDSASVGVLNEPDTFSCVNVTKPTVIKMSSEGHMSLC